MPNFITVNGKNGPVVVVSILDKHNHNIRLIIVTGLTTPKGKIDVFAWSRFSTRVQNQIISLSKLCKVEFVCLGMNRPCKGIIDVINGRVNFLD